MATSERIFRLGTGAGFSADRLDPAVDLVAQGRLDVIVFECIGERTLAFAHRDRMADRDATPCFITLTATLRRGCSWMASYTVPMPPDAITRSTWNRPTFFGNRCCSGLGDAVSALCGPFTGPLGCLSLDSRREWSRYQSDSLVMLRACVRFGRLCPVGGLSTFLSYL